MNNKEVEAVAVEWSKHFCDWYGVNDMSEGEGLKWSEILGRTCGNAFVRHETQASGRFMSGNPGKDAVVAVYTEFGLKPRGIAFPAIWDLWVGACRCGDDQLAMRLIDDGFNPDRRAPGYHSAGNYVEKNRVSLPRTWAWFCQRALAKTAAKKRKRSWASGALVEPRAL